MIHYMYTLNFSHENWTKYKIIKHNWCSKWNRSNRVTQIFFFDVRFHPIYFFFSLKHKKDTLTKRTWVTLVSSIIAPNIFHSKIKNNFLCVCIMFMSSQWIRIRIRIPMCWFSEFSFCVCIILKYSFKILKVHWHDKDSKEFRDEYLYQFLVHSMRFIYVCVCFICMLRYVVISKFNFKSLSVSFEIQSQNVAFDVQ